MNIKLMLVGFTSHHGFALCAPQFFNAVTKEPENPYITVGLPLQPIERKDIDSLIAEEYGCDVILGDNKDFPTIDTRLVNELLDTQIDVINEAITKFSEISEDKDDELSMFISYFEN